MRTTHVYSIIIGVVWCLLQSVGGQYVTITHDGPIVLGGTITFRADLYTGNGKRPSGTFKYTWRDNALYQHTYETEPTNNVTTYWRVTYPRANYAVGNYGVEVVVSEKVIILPWFKDICSQRETFDITALLNGNMTVQQQNKTLGNYVSSTSVANMSIELNKGDYDYITKEATSISTFWFISCKYYGQTTDFSFVYNFTTPETQQTVEALVVASYEIPTTIPPTTTPTVPLMPNERLSPTTDTTTLNDSVTKSEPIHATSTINPSTATSSIIKTASLSDATLQELGNITHPFSCLNTSIIRLDPKKTYGYFRKEIQVRAPITNITVEGTNWIQPWDMLSLNVTCKGSGPFHKCLYFHPDKYNVTGNETCTTEDILPTCNFSILHYFLDARVYTIVVIISNNVSTHVYPLTINIYKVTTKAQLSVIVVPVSCSLAAMVLIVFGIAYYIQSRARYTVEVADFDFGQNNPEMEYKTFTERLRDSFNNAVRPGTERINGYKPLSNSQLIQEQ